MSRFRLKGVEKRRVAGWRGLWGDKGPEWVSLGLVQKGKDGQRPIVDREKSYTVPERGSSRTQASSLQRPANRLVRLKVI